MFCAEMMNPTSFSLKMLLIAILLMLKSDGNADVPNANPLATITEVTISFNPLQSLTQFNCSTRYKVSGSQPISLYINDKLEHSVYSGDSLNHDIKNVKHGEYKCKVGSNEFKLHVSHDMNEILQLNTTKISYHANLVTAQTRIEYESFQVDNTFQCYQQGVDMEVAFHNKTKEVETKGYNGSLKPKIHTDYNCFINKTENFTFLATNNVEDLYPRISAFHVHIMPNPHGGIKLNISCQTRTSNNPTIMLFTNNYFYLVERKYDDYAWLEIDYNATQETFKCIVQNEYGRDVISWGGQNIEEHLNQNDSFKYEVNADKQITKIIYISGQPRNLDNISCSVEQKNKYVKLTFEKNSENKKEFFKALDKFIRYRCRLVGNKEFETELYTKDWLKMPKLTGMLTFAGTSHSKTKNYSQHISCNVEGVNTIGSPFIMSLFENDKIFKARKYIWQGTPEYFSSSKDINELTKSRCIIENEMGYDMLTVEYKTQLRNFSKIWLEISMNAEKINSSFIYMPQYHGAPTKCVHNNATEIENKKFSYRFDLLEDKQTRGDYSCTNRYNFGCVGCETIITMMNLTWISESMNFFPDGSLKLKDRNDVFERLFGFYEEKYLYPQISAFHVNVVPNPTSGFRLHVACLTRTPNNPKIMLFFNRYDLIESKRGNHISSVTDYANLESFKCVVENEYGRDVIIFRHHNLEKYLNQKDSFEYEVNTEKQETKMIYTSGQHRNLDNVSCFVKENNKYIKLEFVKNSENEIVFLRKLDKSIQYKCNFIENKQFETHLYTKDWLQLPKLTAFIIVAKPIHQQSELYHFHVKCEAAYTWARGFRRIVSLYSGEKLLQQSRQSIRQKDVELEFVESENHFTEYNKLRCIVENEMGYDMVSVYFNTQLPNNSSVELRIFLEDDTAHIFYYYRPGANKSPEITKCKHNNETEELLSYFGYSIRLKNKQNHGNYSCTSNTTLCSKSGFCQNEMSMINFALNRTWMNFFPNGSLKQKAQVDEFWNYFGFYSRNRNEIILTKTYFQNFALFNIDPTA